MINSCRMAKKFDKNGTVEYDGAWFQSTDNNLGTVFSTFLHQFIDGKIPHFNN